MPLAVDASVVVQACITSGFGELSGHEIVAPPLLWSEVPSALHELKWRGAISEELATGGLERFMASPIARRNPRKLVADAWRVADELGWAKTYDAEYVALAQMLRCPLVTVDDRLRRGAGRVIEVLGPRDL